MYKRYIIWAICVSASIRFSESGTPSFITKCKTTDSKCLKSSTKAAVSTFTAGISELNIEPLQPLFIKFINASQANLIFTLKDVIVTGLQNWEPKKVQFTPDGETTSLSLSILCTGKLDGQYELKGSVLVIPIQGNGKIYVDLRSALINIDMDMVEKIGKDGKKHWHIKCWSHNFDLKDKSEVVFENLYKENEILARAARQLVANNGNDVIKEIGPPVIKVIVAKVVKRIEQLFKAVPSEDLRLD